MTKHSRFGKYRSSTEGDYAPLRKLQEGEQFTARLLGSHDYESDDGPVPVLDCEDVETGEAFGWMASSWMAREQLAEVEPEDGNLIRVQRGHNRGRSHVYAITVLAEPQGAKDGRDDDAPF